MKYLALLFISFAADRSWHVGEELSYRLPVCISMASAVKIVDIESKDGFEAGVNAFIAAEDCDGIPVTNATVGKVVHSAKVKRQDRDHTLSVVEIFAQGRVVAYFLTTLPVVARLTVVPERGTNS